MTGTAETNGGPTPGALQAPGRGFLLSAALILACGILAVLAAGWMELGPGVRRGLAWGVAVPALGSLSWLVPLRLTARRGGNTFLAALVGGLAFRMVLYGGALVLALRAGAHLGTLLVALFIFHLAYQVAEIVAVHRGRRSGPASGVTRAAAAAALAVALTLGGGTGQAEAAGGKKTDSHGEAAHGGDHGDEEHGFDVLHHIIDSHEIELPWGVVHLPQNWMVGGIDMAPTKHVVWVWIAALLTLVFVLAGKRSAGMVPRGLGNALETVVVFIRDEVARKNISHHADRFTPYLCSLFFFILFCNLAGLVPYGATATGNLNVTGGLALLSMIMIQGAGLRENGLVAHLKALCPIPDGVPLWLLPLYVPIIIAVEVVGIFAKPIALALRLFANMTAGHVVILSLLGLIFILQTHFVVPVSVGFALFIYCLEVFVGFVQAYIFTMLTALFIGMSQHPAH